MWSTVDRQFLYNLKFWDLWSRFSSLIIFFQTQIKQEYEWPQNPSPTKVKGRPGRKAKLSDSELTPIELEKRELRRLRNKQAARRCRQRRLEKTFTLEQKVS